MSGLKSGRRRFRFDYPVPILSANKTGHFCGMLDTFTGDVRHGSRRFVHSEVAPSPRAPSEIDRQLPYSVQPPAATYGRRSPVSRESLHRAGRVALGRLSAVRGSGSHAAELRLAEMIRCISGVSPT
jgi:hypothetical protein